MIFGDNYRTAFGKDKILLYCARMSKYVHRFYQASAEPNRTKFRETRYIKTILKRARRKLKISFENIGKLNEKILAKVCAK